MKLNKLAPYLLSLAAFVLAGWLAGHAHNAAYAQETATPAPQSRRYQRCQDRRAETCQRVRVPRATATPRSDRGRR